MSPSQAPIVRASRPLFRRRPGIRGWVALAALLAFAGCTGESASTGGGGGSSTSTSATGGGGAGGESLPPLDPMACPVTLDSGADPAIEQAASAQIDLAFAPPESGSIQQDKAFFLATVLGAAGAAKDAIAADPALSAISMDRDARLRGAPDDCGTEVPCFAAALGWSTEEADAASSALVDALTAAGALSEVAGGMRKSGRFALHAALADDAALVKAAFQDMAFALGQALSGEAESLGGAKLHDVVAKVAEDHPEPFLFFEPLVAVDLAALTADQRDEAARYEPLATGENAKALAHIPDIEFADYPFTVIVVPGQGPTNLEDHLAPDGQKRADLAAARFAAKIAPLIALSGGHVHPDRTPYSEAIEMKKYLISTYSIPEEAILVDPHARHTTTNLRNVTRLLVRYGVPTDRAALVTTTFGQAVYIGYWHGTFGPRCMDELGYLPWRSLEPISDTDVCMIPAAVSLHADGRDPLDP